MAIEIFGGTDEIDVADAASISFADVSFTLCGLVYLKDVTIPTISLIRKWDYLAGQREYQLAYYGPGNGDRFLFGVSPQPDGGGSNTQLANNYGAGQEDVWVWLCAWHDHIANTINICVNNGAVDSKAYANGCNDGTSALWLGKDLLGYLEDVRLFDRVITAEERALLYAGERGPLGGEVCWPDMCSADGISVWDGAVLVEDTNYLPDLSPNNNKGNPIGNPVGRAGQCPTDGKSHSKRQFMGLI